MISLYNYIFENTSIENKLIDKYIDNFNNLSRHCKVHLITRGHLIEMFSNNTENKTLKENAKTFLKVLELFNNDIDTLLNDYVLIGYKSDKRKQKIGRLFESVNDKYKKFLCLITILEMTYTYQRVGKLNLIDINLIKSIINENIELIQSCIEEDKYDFRKNASTKYINAIYFIHNLKQSISELNCIKLNDSFFENNIKYFIQLYSEKPDATTLYGITHIIIGASDFYQKSINKMYQPLLNILYGVIEDKVMFESLTIDLRMEMLLCCKLFGIEFSINMDKYIDFDNLEENEHTNMLYILLKKHRIK